ncbi:two-component system sensor histidine kinase NtrB [Lignipirellula cremea]|uniref:histidine kinase n=1 Tax=Lignipirellula cremea TaxID=2528010 RepID=A0A518DZV5_9BACT|nr:ATP-binding protein [Lignipirellula cremea]QDU97369.1 Sensor protein ZraS [Lignipirellula cremea]
MFHVQEARLGTRLLAAIGAVVLLSFTALSVTVWILKDFERELEIVARMMEHLPATDMASARELAGDLRLQSRLTVLMVLNVILTAAALALLVRAYMTSQRSLRDVKVLAGDILASMDQGVITTDRNIIITSINPSGCALLGLEGDWIGRPLQSVGEKHQTLEGIVHHVLESHERVRDLDYAVENHGHPRNYRAGCTLLRDEQQIEIGAVLHVRDVTQRTLMDQRLRRMERYMGLGSLAAGLHHEIKNPLSALSLHVQLLDEELQGSDTTPEIDEMLGVLRSEVVRIAGVLEGFRNYASMSHLRRSEAVVGSLVEKLARLIGPQAKQQGVELKLDLPEPSATKFSVDAIRIEQLLLNLVLNALQVMPQGGVLTIAVKRRGDTLQLEVGDTGPGIPEDLRDKIFDPYFTTRSDGNGMGLALCEKIVRQHNGSLEFTTGPQGTVFVATLPPDENTA